MPEVTEEFVKRAGVLSKEVPNLLARIAEQEKAAALPKQADVNVTLQAEIVADTLIQQGLVRQTEKSAAVAQLTDHKECLAILNKTAQQVEATSLGAGQNEKKASDERGSTMRESDRVLFARLGLNVG